MFLEECVREKHAMSTKKPPLAERLRDLSSAPLEDLVESSYVMKLAARVQGLVGEMMEAYVNEDPAWKDHAARLARAADELRRAAGRPRLPPGETRAEKVTRYLEAHDLKATTTHFGLSEETVLRYERRARGRRGQ
jgi:hypothetical protein